MSFGGKPQAETFFFVHLRQDEEKTANECFGQALDLVEAVPLPARLRRAFAFRLQFPHLCGVRAGGVLCLPGFDGPLSCAFFPSAGA